MIELKIQKTLHGAQGQFQLDIHLDVVEGDIVAIFGPSGAGKTMLLRCLAGLEQPDSGTLRVKGQLWFDAKNKCSLPPQARQVGYMFQDYALFPNMTVSQNIEFALPKGADKKRVNALLEMMTLGELQYLKPETLSGGQKQRVALARALASEPKLLLLDEPFSALDAQMRAHLHDELLRLQKQYGLTTIIVSHDIAEVYKLTHRVFVLESGKIVANGTPEQVFSAGQTSGKFRFTGEILAIQKMDVMVAFTVLVSNQIVRVVAMPDEANSLKQGDRVMLVSKAFNPMVFKLS